MQGNNNATLTEIRKTEIFNAPIQKVWDAVSTSEGIAAWFMPNDFQPILGHDFILHAGPYGDSPCKVTEFDPPKRLGFNWGKDWLITFELMEMDGKTEFTLVHSGWDAEKVTEFGEPHTEVRGKMGQGWEFLITNLQKLVEA